MKEPLTDSPSESAKWTEYDFTKIPFQNIERVGQISLLERDLFCVSWLLGRFCNFKCSYCWPYARADKRDHRPLPVLIKAMDSIKAQARARGFNSFHFSFSGGEPTLHPNYLEFLQYYADDNPNTNGQTVHMTSNLSPGIGWFKKYIAATLKLNRVSITASFHKEFTERKAFRDKIHFLQENEVQVTINMVMVPARFDLLWEDALFFHAAKINVTLKPQSNPSATRVVDGYSQEQLDRLQKGMPQADYTHSRMREKQIPYFRPPMRNRLHTPTEEVEKNVASIFQVRLTDNAGKDWYLDQAERFNAFNFNQFKDWDCSAGFRSVIIREPDGFVKRSYSCHDQPLGHIEKGFELFKTPMPCGTQSCVSSADSKIPKRKAGTRWDLFPTEKNKL